MNLQREYAREVVADVMHNVVPNLATAQRARDQAKYLRERNAELLALAVDIGALRNETSPVECTRKMNELIDRAGDLVAKARGNAGA